MVYRIRGTEEMAITRNHAFDRSNYSRNRLLNIIG